MAWSKVSNKHSKPFKWWMHKLLCEFGWWFRRINDLKGTRIYYKHLNKLCNYGFNLYGEKI